MLEKQCKEELQIAFNDKKILLTTRQPKKLRNMLVGAKFETKTIPKSPKLTGLFLCNNCVYHKAGCTISCSPFSFKLTNTKTVSWTYKNYFSCDSKNVIYTLIRKTLDSFHIGQTQDSKQRIANINQISKARPSRHVIFREYSLSVPSAL